MAALVNRCYLIRRIIDSCSQSWMCTMCLSIVPIYSNMLAVSEESKVEYVHVHRSICLCSAERKMRTTRRTDVALPLIASLLDYLFNRLLGASVMKAKSRISCTMGINTRQQVMTVGLQSQCTEYVVLVGIETSATNSYTPDTNYADHNHDIK